MKKILFSLLAAVALLAIALPTAHAQARATSGAIPYLGSAYIVNSNATTNINAVLDLRQGDFGMMAGFTRTNAGTDNVTLTFDVSPDGGTTYSTKTWTWVIAGNGTTAVFDRTNFASSTFAGFDKLRLKSIANATAGDTIIVSNVWIFSPNPQRLR
jgi:hypothetical protein